jgi:hypothetical protein
MFHAISHHRRKWVNRAQLCEPETLEATLVYNAPVPENLTCEEILTALQKLPHHFAEVVLLSDVHDFTYKEIETTLGIPAGTVMSRLSRGRSCSALTSRRNKSRGIQVLPQHGDSGISFAKSRSIAVLAPVIGKHSICLRHCRRRSGTFWQFSADCRRDLDGLLKPNQILRSKVTSARGNPGQNSRGTASGSDPLSLKSEGSSRG